MNSTQHKATITKALQRFVDGDLAENTRNLLETLGYRSDRTIAFESNTVQVFIENFCQFDEMNLDKARLQEWESIDFLFQLTKAEIVENPQLQIVFENDPVYNKIIESYLFFVLQLRGPTYDRTNLSQITHEINKLTPMPVIVIFQYGSFLALATMDRRLSKRGPSRDVLEKITLIEDIDFRFPDDAHVEILFNLSLNELYRQYRLRSFLKFHQAWQETLDSFDPSELKPRQSVRHRYDHDKYPSEEIAEISTAPYAVIHEIFGLPYEAIFDDIEYEMATEQHDIVASIIKRQYKII